MKKFNQDVERLRHILEILKSKNLRQKDLKVYQKLGYHTIKRVVILFSVYGNKEAEKVLLKALDCDDEEIQFIAHFALLKAERLGKKLLKRTLARLQKTEEETQ